MAYSLNDNHNPFCLQNLPITSSFTSLFRSIFVSLMHFERPLPFPFAFTDRSFEGCENKRKANIYIYWKIVHIAIVYDILYLADGSSFSLPLPISCLRRLSCCASFNSTLNIFSIAFSFLVNCSSHSMFLLV